ncbi:MAG: exo-alpha-sialidase [Clostridia bacterium]|nr:exo-alpha-sialidase [Clostridia bacterium]
MKAVTSWSFKHYVPLNEPARMREPYICRIAPTADSFTFDFIDLAAKNASYRLFWRIRGDIATHGVSLDGYTGTVTGLADATDYEFWVERDDGVKSSVRLVRTGDVPGTVITYLHPDDREYEFSGNYLCSPSVIRVPDGRLLASMDVFAGGTPQNLTLIYESRDDGKTWQHLTELFPCFWGKMFLCRGKLYMLGCSTEYGDLLIGRSDDFGENWTLPMVILRGACDPRWCGCHRAPMPVLEKDGRIMTDLQFGSWAKKTFSDAVVSAPADADLLDPASWVCSEMWNVAESAPQWLDRFCGGIEGTMIEAPDGTVYDFLRCSDRKALLLRYDVQNPEGALVFEDVIDFPATASKWDVIRDEVTGKYIAIVSWALDEPKTLRNLLSLIWSDDLRHWHLAEHLIDFRDADTKMVGFQYIDFFIEGEDIYYTNRVALNQAHNFHDANYQTFHKVEGFRSLLVEADASTARA